MLLECIYFPAVSAQEGVTVTGRAAVEMQQDSLIQGSITSSQLIVTHWISMTGSHPRELTIHRHVTQMFESPEIAIFWRLYLSLNLSKNISEKKVIMDKNIFNGNSESSSQSFSLYHRVGRNLFNSNRSLSLSELSGKDYRGRAARDRVGEVPRLFSYYTMPHASIPTGPATGNMPGWFVL